MAQPDQDRRSMPTEVTAASGDAHSAPTSLNAADLASDAPPTAFPGLPRRVARSTGSGLPQRGSPGAARLATGSVVKDRFVLESELGAGGMGRVFRARDLRKDEAQDPNPWLAIKFLAGRLRGYDKGFMALQREAQHAQKLNHPNIIKVFDFDRDGDLVFLTMELLEGESLDHRLARLEQEPWRRGERERIVEGLLAGLAYAHRQGVTHADLKPSNVFIDQLGNAKLLDFGIARGAERDLAFDPDEIGAMTPTYASIEMLSGQRPGPRDDVYAAGCIVHEIYQHAHPFDGLRADRALERALRPAPLGLARRPLRRATLRALSFEARRRWPDAGAYLRAARAPDLLRWAQIATLAALLLGGLGWLFADDAMSLRQRAGLSAEQTLALEAALSEAAARRQGGFAADALDPLLDVLRLDPYNRTARSEVRDVLDQLAAEQDAASYAAFLQDIALVLDRHEHPPRAWIRSELERRSAR